MSPLKSELRVEIDRTTMNLINRKWPRTGMSKNQFIDVTLVKGTRYDEEIEALRAEIKRLRGEL